ncbi:hypothetical protein [Rhodohalobacter sp.]|uniref:hypothetical protein n=1 Tax=Rhodohalobacter sp. TaxID=1974210 RepID=UPI002ACDAB46|nr:hypothetical protein [Rhodohalobacter sp.]MDZ7756232.1 hypothetical protein [Rhodohalobacter sp.]
MSDKQSSSTDQSPIERFIPTGFYDVIKQERTFIGLIGVFFFIAGVVFPYAEIAMWVGFAFAGYSAIANDSIQTIGTFLASNADKKWWVLMVMDRRNIFGYRSSQLVYL